jgi:Arc/MetJ-type ribon-helix-helix transcriptional regulator
MVKTAQTFSISLGQCHEDYIATIAEKIRTRAKKTHTNRSEAVQIALRFLSEKDDAPVAKLVKANSKFDNRRKPK